MTIQPLLDAPLFDTPSEYDPFAALPVGDRSYVLESLKIVYISLPKNACTSLRWLIAELAGEDLNGFCAGLAPILHAEGAIHRRAQFQRTPRLREIDPQVWRDISPENGWFVFGVVRDPRARLFSAWQNKLLMHTPGYTMWRAADWYPSLPDDAEDIARDFARFVELLEAQPEHPIARDGHFRAQTRMLRPDVIPYSRIYDVTEIGILLADLAKHLRPYGVHRELALRRTNDTPLRANGRVLAGSVRSRIERLYAVDFDNFGRLWDYRKIESVGDWTPSSVQELRARALLHERTGELLARARDEWQRAQSAEKQLEQANRLIVEMTQRTEQAQQRAEDLQREANDVRQRLRLLELRAAHADQRIAELESMRSTRVGLFARRLRGRLRGLAAPLTRRESPAW